MYLSDDNPLTSKSFYRGILQFSANGLIETGSEMNLLKQKIVINNGIEQLLNAVLGFRQTKPYNKMPNFDVSSISFSDS